MIQAIYSNLRKSVDWIHAEFRTSMENLSKDLRSMRIIWVWLILSLYFFISIYSVLNYGNKWGGVAITVTGAMVSWILSNYIISKQHDKYMTNQKKVVKEKKIHKNPAKPENSEDEASD